MGIVYTYRKGWRFGLYGEVATVFSSSFLLIWMLDFDYEYLKISVFRPYLLVAYCILALWFGLGINVLMRIVAKWNKLSSPIIYISFSIVIIALGIWNGRTNYRANDRFAEQLAQSLFDVVEQDAILVPRDDAYVFSTVYYHLVEGKRPDIRLLESGGLFLNDRILQPLWSKKQRYTAWQKFVKNTNRPFYHQGLLFDIVDQIGHYDIGVTYKTDNNLSPRTVKIEDNDVAKAFFKEMIALPQTNDMWITYEHNRTIETYGKYLGYAIAWNNSTMNNYIKDVLPLAENNYWSLIGMSTALLQQNSSKYVAVAKKYLEKAKDLADNQRRKSDKALVFYLEGCIAKIKGNSRKAIIFLT